MLADDVCSPTPSDAGSCSPTPSDVKTAIVSTQRGVRATLESFIRWHLDGACFDHLFLFLDAPNEDAGYALSLAARYSPHVTVLMADEQFRQRERYESLPSWQDVEATVATQVQSRQRLNCEHCLRLCASAGLRWLLHIDADELWVPSGGEDARTHFGRLEALGTWQFTYRNLEAVPSSACGEDVFASVNLFKQHESELPDAANEAGSNAHEAREYWLSRTRERLGDDVWFYFYTNGKSAVRVDPDGAWQHLRCGGVHAWNAGDPDGGEADDDTRADPMGDGIDDEACIPDEPTEIADHADAERGQGEPRIPSKEDSGEEDIPLEENVEEASEVDEDRPGCGLLLEENLEEPVVSADGGDASTDYGDEEVRDAASDDLDAWGVGGSRGMGNSKARWRTNLRSLAEGSAMLHARLSRLFGSFGLPHRNSFVRLFEDEGCVVLHYACCTARGFASKDWHSLGYLNEDCGEWTRRWHRMRVAAETAPSDAEASAMRLMGLPESIRQEEAQQQLGAEHAALFWISPEEQAAAEAGVEASVLVREKRVQRLLQTRRKHCPSGKEAQAALECAEAELDELDGDMASALLALTPAERSAHLKSRGFKLGMRLRIEAELRRLLKAQTQGFDVPSGGT